MPDAWTQNYYHLFFSTSRQRPLISQEIEPQLHQRLREIASELACRTLAIGGTPDHIHMVLQYPPDLAHATLVRKLKDRSSQWIRATFPALADFAWQSGYGGFTVGRSALDAAIETVKRQKDLHARVSFEDEFLAMLVRHGMHVAREDALA